MKGSEYALLVARETLAEHYKEVEAFQTARAKSARRLSKVIAAVATIAVLGMLRKPSQLPPWCR